MINIIFNIKPRDTLSPFNTEQTPTNIIISYLDPFISIIRVFTPEMTTINITMGL
jgi:hypothetical protein